MDAAFLLCKVIGFVHKKNEGPKNGLREIIIFGSRLVKRVIFKIIQEQLVKVITAMIETELTFFEMEAQGRTVEAAKLGQPHLGDAPEVFDAIDVRLVLHKLIATVIHPVMFLISRQNSRSNSRNCFAEIRERRKYRFFIVTIGFIACSHCLN